jgi:hypothetical protein
MSAEKQAGLCSFVLFPQKLDYSNRFLFNLEFTDVCYVPHELLHDDGQTGCGTLIFYVFIADTPKFGVLCDL